MTLFELVRLKRELTNELGVDVDLVTRDPMDLRVAIRVTGDIFYV